MEALDTLIQDEMIPPQLANRIIDNFDRIISEMFKNDNILTHKSKLTFKGDLHTYRFCDDVWTFIIKNVLIKLSDSIDLEDGSNEVKIEKFKIVANNSRRAGET